MEKFILVLTSVLLLSFNAFASTKIAEYGFEDCDSDYPVTSGESSYMTTHANGSECIESYNANEMSQTWGPHSGDLFLLQNDGGYALDPSVSGITSGSVNLHNNFWLGEDECPTSDCSDLYIQDEISSGEIYVSFWARMNKGWYSIEDGGRNKFIRFYADTHDSDDTVYMHLSTSNGVSPTMFFYCADEGYWIPGESGPSLTNAYDGNWHKYSMYVNWNTGIIKAWYDKITKLLKMP